MERHRVGFSWTGSTLVGIGACLNSYVSLLGVRMTHDCALVLMLIEYMKRCRDGFGRTAGISACNMTPSQLNTHLLCKHTTMAMTSRKRWLLKRKYVGIGGCMFEFEGVINWYTVYNAR